MAQGVVDACCIINVYAAGNLKELLGSSGLDWHVPTLVQKEVGKIRKPDPDDPAKLIDEPIDLQPLIDAGLFHSCEAATEAETELFVEIAANLDDGEAMALAIAVSRNWVLATDDHKAMREATRRGVTTTGTPELVKKWADKTGASDIEVGQVLHNIQRFARFQPRKTALLFRWWHDLAAKASH